MTSGRTKRGTLPGLRSIAMLFGLSIFAAACGTDAPADTIESIAPTDTPTASPAEAEPRPATDEATPPVRPTVDPRPLTSTVQDLADLAALPTPDTSEPPPGASLAIGTLIRVDASNADRPLLYLVELAPDSHWVYVQDGSSISQNHLVQDPLTIGIAAEWTEVRNCEPGPAQPARVEVWPAGPLSRVGQEDSLFASAWLTITCTDVDLIDVDEARSRWVGSGVNVYRHNLRGRIAGEKATVIVESTDGVIRQRRVDQSVGRYDVDSLFDQIIEVIIDEDLTASVFFDPELGHPVEVEIVGPDGELLFLETRAFGSTVREPACEVGTGSALDLSAEPVVFVIGRPDYQRWYDADGCPVRIDIISDRGGASHCEWDRARFLAFSNPIGSEPTRSFLWDPDRTLSSRLTDPVGNVWTTISIVDLPETAEPTGYHTVETELWLDPADPGVAYVIDGQVAELRRLIPPNLFGCA